MNMNEPEFGLKIKQQLDQSLDLKPAELDRLRAARERALKRQRIAEPVFGLVWVDAVMGRMSGNPASTGIALAGAALIMALVGIQYWQQTPTVEEIEEIDAALLTSELPINAYLDKSFDSWLKRSQH
ncbi:MAG: DUF3619 family protein [Proteobacteria bacterium]|nr:DUF3619 family protein [Pseudomonadota bacterium]